MMTDHDGLSLARRAARQLATDLRDEPDVTLVDVGLDAAARPCIRVHVSDDPSTPRASLPSHVEGVPVVTRHGDYDLQADRPAERRTAPPEGGEG